MFPSATVAQDPDGHRAVTSFSMLPDGDKAVFVCPSDIASSLAARYPFDENPVVEDHDKIASLPFTPVKLGGHIMDAIATSDGPSPSAELQVITSNQELIATTNADRVMDPRCDWRDAVGNRMDPHGLKILKSFTNINPLNLYDFIAANADAPLFEVPATTKINCLITGSKHGAFVVSIPQFRVYYVSLAFTEDGEPAGLSRSLLLACVKAIAIVNALDPTLSSQAQFILDHAPTIELMTDPAAWAGAEETHGARERGDPEYDTDIIIPVYDDVRLGQSDWVHVDNHFTMDTAMQDLICTSFEFNYQLLAAALM